ncbi:hypothetical protein [Micromonospora sp. CPCC 206061]|uniref:hypothetical protein n=1 Tax=Micromonospora sp. CPCC 206061 TaxID=3122410 RepID=UPI002FF33EBF
MPLRIAPGWLVSYNRFYEGRPDLARTPTDDADYFTQDMLQLNSCRRGTGGEWEIDPTGFLIDLGWYPDSDPDGTYRLVVVSPDFRGEELFEIEHRDPVLIRDIIGVCTTMLAVKADLSDLIEQIHHMVSTGPL